MGTIKNTFEYRIFGYLTDSKEEHHNYYTLV